jgi:uncharacterized phage protein (TIGR01671 family)
MSREIKFRVWDKANKCWLNYDDIFISQEGGVYEIEERTWAYQSYMHQENIAEKVEITQYTGLKDKNGKEIYERDILKDDGNFLWFVSYKNGGFFIECLDLMANETLLCENEMFVEVVGNIYENPELLED